jgi:non-ribosomal peptide synthetase component F
MTVSDTRREPKEISGAETLLARRIHDLFETLAALVPGAPAVIAARESLTYGELDRRANRLARHLRSLGLGTEERVAVALDRSPEAVAAVLAVWKAGGAWIPLDLSWPAARLGLLLEESVATFLIAREESAAALAAAAPPWPLLEVGELPPLWQILTVRLDRDAAEIAGQSDAPLRSPAGPEHLACLLPPAAPEPPGGPILRMTHRELVLRALGGLPGGQPGTGPAAEGRSLSLEEILQTFPRGAALHLGPDAGAVKTD